MLYRTHDKNKAKKVKCVVYGGPESSTRSGLTEYIQTDKTKANKHNTMTKLCFLQS